MARSVGMRRARKSPLKGAEDGAAAIFRPEPGLQDFAASPRLTGGLFSSALASDDSEHARISTFRSHTRADPNNGAALCGFKTAFCGTRTGILPHSGLPANE